LRHAFTSLQDAFPWASGDVISEDGVFRIRSQQKKQIVVHDIRDDSSYPSYEALAAANFPYKWLDERIVSSRGTIAEANELETGIPVCSIQANLLRGGVMLSFDCQHGSMDMAGQVQLIRMIAKAYRGEAYTTDELSVGNMVRSNVVHMLHTEAPITKSHPPTRQSLESSRSPLVWSNFDFPAQALAKLKAEAMCNVIQGSFVSTDDVLSAFIWQSISRIRARRLGQADRLETTLSRNVDGRHCLGLPTTYPGLIVTSTLHTKPISEVSTEPIGAIASSLRIALGPEKLQHQLRRQTLSTKGGNSDETSVSTSPNPALDVRLSSWAKEKAYDIDFGPDLGRPDSVRTPRFARGAREGLVYFLPKTGQGSIVVGLCLGQDDMLALSKDELMLQYTIYKG
jgi:hypothetical protein